MHLGKKKKKERNEINQTIQTNKKTWSFLLFVCLFLSMSFNKLSAYSKPLLPMLSHFIPVQFFETPMDYSLPGPSLHGIFPSKKILTWIAMLSSRGSSKPRD